MSGPGSHAESAHSEVRFRCIFLWDSREDEVEWVSRFREEPYILLGHLAHRIGLICDEVFAEHIVLKRLWPKPRVEHLDDQADDSGF